MMRSCSGLRVSLLCGGSFESEFVVNVAQLPFHNDHLLVKSSHGSFFHLGGGAGLAGNLAHEPDVAVNTFTHCLDAMDLFHQDQRKVRGGPRV